MRKLLSSSAIAVIVGAMSVGAHAQDSTQVEGEATQTASICENPWNMVDGNADAFINKEEATGAIEDEFAQIDTDDNGEITKTEYIDCKTQGLDMQSAEVTRDEQSFTTADANQDESIDRTEYRQAAQQAYESRSDASADGAPAIIRFVWLAPEELTGGIAQDMPVSEVAQRSALMFQRLDVNNDNIVDGSEWDLPSAPLGLTQDLADARFDEMDINASGALEQDEYAEARSPGLDATQTSSTAATTDDQASAAADANEQSGVPVFIYWLPDA